MFTAENLCSHLNTRMHENWAIEKQSGYGKLKDERRFHCWNVKFVWKTISIIDRCTQVLTEIIKYSLQIELNGKKCVKKCLKKMLFSIKISATTTSLENTYNFTISEARWVISKKSVLLGRCTNKTTYYQLAQPICELTEKIFPKNVRCRYKRAPGLRSRKN